MNRDRPSAQVMDPVSSPSSSPSSSRQGQETSTAGLSKIEAMALLLKQKVAGSSTKQQRVPNKINHPWALSTSTRSSSFPSPTSAPTTPTGSSSSSSPSSSSTLKGSPFYMNKNNSSSSTNSAVGGMLTTATAMGHKKESSIKAMIAAREDPSLSCNKMAPPTTQPGPAPQRREARGAPGPGMTKVQLGGGSRGSSTTTTTAVQDPGRRKDLSTSPPSPSTPVVEQSPPSSSAREMKENRSTLATDPLSPPKQLMTVMGALESGVEGDDINLPGNRKTGSSSREDGPHGVLASATPPTATTSAAPSTPTSASSASTATASRRRNAGGALVPSQFAASGPPVLTFSTSSSSLTACVTNTLDGENGSLPTMDEDAKGTKTETAVPSSIPSPAPTSSLSLVSDSSKSPTEKAPGSLSLSSKPPSPPSSSTSSSTTTPKASSTVDSESPLLKRPSRATRRHTTASSSSSSSLLSGGTHSSPFSSPTQQPMGIINPTLRQLQTPQIPLNLVQARILQQEEQKRRDEELAKIPITANLRTVKKIQAVIVSSDDEDDDKDKAADKRKRREEASAAAMSESAISEESSYFSPEGPSSRSSSSSLSSSTGSRPRSKTATATSASTVLVSTLHGYHKQRGDRNHVEPVAIPKRLADQVEHILGRKLAGKGSVLDEREKEREEEEARKAAEPLPPIILGHARKRAVTSAHIQNLVSSWDHKVEEAKETTTEAERIRQFLEARSTAHAEMPKPKTPLTASELLAPLPPLPPPPPMSEQTLGESMRRKGGRHVKGARSASVSTGGYSILSASALSSSSKPPSFSRMPSSPTMTDTLASKSILTRQPSRSKTQPKIQIEGQEGNLETSKSVLDSGLDASLGGQQEVQKPTRSTTASRSKLPASTKKPNEEETKRSGALLVNKAVTSRPRRTGVRVPTSSASANSEEQATVNANLNETE